LPLSYGPIFVQNPLSDSLELLHRSDDLLPLVASRT